MKKFLPFFLVFSALLLFWEMACAHSKEMLFIIPAPSKIAHTVWELRSRFCLHTSVTLKEMLIGFALALTVAFPLAWTMLHFRTTRTLFQPLFIVIQCIPMFTLAPIMVVWFGWSQAAIIIPTALMIFFPLTLNIYQGLRATPRPFLEYFALNHATPWQTFLKLRLPWALPHIFAGFRISAAIAGVGAVAGEWAGAQQGLGVLMLESRRNTDLEITFGALLCLTLMSTMLYALIILCEKIPYHWRIEWKFQKPAMFAKKRLSFPLFTLLLLLFSGCGQNKAQTRLLLDWLPNVNHVPLYAGIEKGFFKEEGIDLQLQKMYECGGAISYLTSRQADLIIGHLPGTLKAAARGAQLKIVGQLIDRPLRALIYLKDERVKKPCDLSGKVLGYCIGGPDTSFLDYMLDNAHIKPIERKNVSSDLISPMGTRAVEFIYGGYWNVEPHILRSLGVETNNFPLEELNLPPYQELIIVANEDIEPEFVAKFQRALQKSLSYAKEHQEEAFALYLNANPDKSDKTVAWEKDAWIQTAPLFCNSQDINMEGIAKYYEWQFERGIVHNEYCTDQLKVAL
ncbi:MAG: ABC transporter permease/substrate-binding protein [Chlamydiales bacterium]|nr:ABC transporter permease/substrate-binding protein [Chlamydiales bacterium]